MQGCHLALLYFALLCFWSDLEGHFASLCFALPDTIWKFWDVVCFLEIFRKFWDFWPCETQFWVPFRISGSSHYVFQRYIPFRAVFGVSAYFLSLELRKIYPNFSRFFIFRLHFASLCFALLCFQIFESSLCFALLCFWEKRSKSKVCFALLCFHFGRQSGNPGKYAKNCP